MPNENKPSSLARQLAVGLYQAGSRMTADERAAAIDAELAPLRAKAEALAEALQALVDRSAWFDTGVTHVGLSNAAVLASARAALAEYEGA